MIFIRYHMGSYPRQVTPAKTCLRVALLRLRLLRGVLDAAFDHAGCDGISGETSCFMDIEFIHHLLSMLLYSLDAYAQ